MLLSLKGLAYIFRGVLNPDTPDGTLLATNTFNANKLGSAVSKLGLHCML
jgi:hypothetical protein